MPLTYAQSSGGKMDFNYNYTLTSQGIVHDTDESTSYDRVGGFMVFGFPNQQGIAYNLNDAGQFL